MIEVTWFTSDLLQLFLYRLQKCLNQNLRECKHHGEEHPDVEHLDVGGRRQGLGDPDETGSQLFDYLKDDDLQRGEH